jgi:CheY-like chemotaxis protein
MPEIGAYQRILLVDDNVDATNMLRDMLTDLGYQVAVAYDGPQALVALETFRPDVAVIDIGLPVMDGYELASHIRQDGHVPRLIAMTGYGQPADLARSRQAGFDSHLVQTCRHGCAHRCHSSDSVEELLQVAATMALPSDSSKGPVRLSDSLESNHAAKANA